MDHYEPALHSPSPTMMLTSPFIHGALPSLRLPKLQPFSPSPPPPPPSISIAIKAMKTMQGRVVCATNDKTVAVEVVRLAPHPKYKRRVRKKKIYQAHDADNRFRVGDFVQLEQSRPISKTKSFIALPVTAKNVPKASESIPEELLGIPLQSQQQQPE